jgi:uncharacterized membrane protein
MQEPASEDNRPSLDPPLFEATLYPHRSLSPRGFCILMAAVAGLSFTIGLTFAAAGAWPILGFFGLDVALVYFAFRFNYRAGRLVETIHLTRSALLIRRIHPGGRIEEWSLQPYWLRVKAVPTSEEVGSPLAEIQLASHGRKISIGCFLTDDERDTLSLELSSALAKCRERPDSL